MIIYITLESWSGEFAVATTVGEYKELMRDFAKFTEEEIEDVMKNIDESRIITSVPSFDKGKRKENHVMFIYPKNTSERKDLVVPSLQLAMAEYIRVFPDSQMRIDMIGRLQRQLFGRIEEIVFLKKGAASGESGEDIGTPPRESAAENGCEVQEQNGCEDDGNNADKVQKQDDGDETEGGKS